MIIRDLVITGLCKLLRNVTVQNLVTEAINEVTKDEISNLSGLTSNVQSQLQQTQAAISTAQMEQKAWKSQISDAINNIPRNPNGDLASTASLDGFLHEIGEIEHGPDVSGVTATPDDIMADRKYVDTDWELKNGTMVRRGTPTLCIGISPSSNNTNTFIKIPKGGYMEGNTDYNEILVPNSDLHNHMGLTAAKILMGQAINYIQGTATSDTNAQTGHILKDKTAYVKGVKVTGSMTNYSGQTVNYAGYETIKIGLEPKDPSSQVQISFENKGGLTGYFDGTTVFKGNMYLPMDKVAYGTKIGRFKDFQTSSDTYLTGSYTGDANAVAKHMASGESAYVKGVKVTGTLGIMGENEGYMGCYRSSSNLNVYIKEGIYECEGILPVVGNPRIHNVLIPAADIVNAYSISSAIIRHGQVLLGVTGTYDSDATATRNFIVEGYTAYAKGNQVIGIIPNRGKKGSKGKHGMVALTATGNWSDINVSKLPTAWEGYHIAKNSDGVRRLCLQVPGGVYGGTPTDVSQTWLDAIGGDGYVGIELSKFGNAKSNQVLEGTTFTSNDCLDGQNIGITGTMSDFSKPKNCDYKSNKNGWGLMRSNSIMETSDKDLGITTTAHETWVALLSPRAGFYNSTAIGTPLQNIIDCFGLTPIRQFLLANGKEKTGSTSKKRILSYTNPEFVQSVINHNFIILNYNGIFDISQHINSKPIVGNIDSYQVKITELILDVKPIIFLCHNMGGGADVRQYSTNMATNPSHMKAYLSGWDMNDNGPIGSIVFGITEPSVKCEITLSENTFDIIIQPVNRVAELSTVGIPADNTIAFVL